MRVCLLPLSSIPVNVWTFFLAWKTQRKFGESEFRLQIISPINVVKEGGNNEGKGMKDRCLETL